jgi:hypothetical protein
MWRIAVTGVHLSGRGGCLGGGSYLQKSMLNFLFGGKIQKLKVICPDENSGAIYYTETYDENMMSVFRIRVGLCCRVVHSESGATKTKKVTHIRGSEVSMQATNDVNPCHDLLHDLLASAV